MDASFDEHGAHHHLSEALAVEHSFRHLVTIAAGHQQD